MNKDIADRIAKLPALRRVISEYRMTARRSLGQNFLLDLNLTRRIARVAGDLTIGTTIEIGPGPGGLTRALLSEGAGRVIAIEKDSRAIDALGSLMDVVEGRLEVLEGDASKLDLATIGEAPRRIVANLPYNIGTKLLFDVLAQAGSFESLTLMFQKEVAERITARVGDPSYGRLSVMCGWLTEAKIMFEVPNSAFTPAPKVTSAVVQLQPRAEPLFPADMKALEKLTAAAFGQRRKMMRASLRPLGGEALLEEAGIDPTSRPETLDIEGFCRLTNLIAARS